jgi:hypothetical protein
LTSPSPGAKIATVCRRHCARGWIDDVDTAVAGCLVNWWPENMSYGTKPENMADKVRDGTGSRGEKHGQAKASEADVIEMRRLWESTKHLGRFDAARWSLPRLSAKFGLSIPAIHKIVKGETWAHV